MVFRRSRRSRGGACKSVGVADGATDLNTQAGGRRRRRGRKSRRGRKRTSRRRRTGRRRRTRRRSRRRRR